MASRSCPSGMWRINKRRSKYCSSNVILHRKRGRQVCKPWTRCKSTLRQIEIQISIDHVCQAYDTSLSVWWWLCVYQSCALWTFFKYTLHQTSNQILIHYIFQPIIMRGPASPLDARLLPTVQFVYLCARVCLRAASNQLCTTGWDTYWSSIFSCW